MGNEQSNKSGVSAVSIVSGLEKDDLFKLRGAFLNYVENSGEVNVISRTDFDSALKSIESIDPSNIEIMDRLFTLLDEPGDSKIDYKLFLVGASLLVAGSVTEKLLFAFQLYDEQNSGYILSSETKKIFSTLNSVVSFFGDPVVHPGQIKDLIIDIYRLAPNPASPLHYEEYIDNIISHPVVNIFVSGRGNVRFGR